MGFTFILLRAKAGKFLAFCFGKFMASNYNPRHSNKHRRDKYRARLKAQGGECGICKGRLGAIHYDEPSDSKHPLSFVVDEIIPVSRWKEFGYDSPEACALDWNNLQAAHWCFNAAKSNKLGYVVKKRKTTTKDGNW